MCHWLVLPRPCRPLNVASMALVRFCYLFLAQWWRDNRDFFVASACVHCELGAQSDQNAIVCGIIHTNNSCRLVLRRPTPSTPCWQAPQWAMLSHTFKTHKTKTIHTKPWRGVHKEVSPPCWLPKLYMEERCYYIPYPPSAFSVWIFTMGEVANCSLILTSHCQTTPDLLI